MRALLRILAHAIGLVPLVVAGYTWWQAGPPLDPVAEYTTRTGDAALWMLLLSLVITPLARQMAWPALGVMRRPLGLYAFAYVMGHVLVYVGLDYAWDWTRIAHNVLVKRYLLAGLVATVCLIPLALTSTTVWQRRLGIWWKRLHRIVYVAALASVLHYLWLVKSDIRIPLVYAAILVVLLALRVRFRPRSAV